MDVVVIPMKGHIEPPMEAVVDDLMADCPSILRILGRCANDGVWSFACSRYYPASVALLDDHGQPGGIGGLCSAESTCGQWSPSAEEHSGLPIRVILSAWG